MNIEPFGPLVLARPFETEAEAIALANATRMGLAAYVYTDSASRQARLVETLRVGMVAINHPSVTSPEAPFGGVGDRATEASAALKGSTATCSRNSSIGSKRPRRARRDRVNELP